MAVGGMDFREMFVQAMGAGNEPFPYQIRIATEPEMPTLMDVPTGAGKTAAVVLGWLWRRRFADRSVRGGTPRRLVYCLPMRVLVEQTRDNVKLWLENIGLLAREAGDDAPVGGWSKEHGDPGGHRIAVTVLMGGEDRDEWDLYPERDAVIIGTQDMLLSRALNRGYGMSRYRWPVHFGLLNNDCLWVMDEVQLMGNGLATSVQMQVFQEQFWKSAVSCQFLWMSATPGKGMFDTRDRSDFSYEKIPDECILHLSEKELKKLPSVIAEKKVTLLKEEPHPRTRSKDGILDIHKPGSFTLLVLNTVPKAQDWFSTIVSNIEKKKNTAQNPEVVLIHGRMRQCDRKSKLDKILDFVEKQKETGANFVPNHPGIILVATQVVEAGLDISSNFLWSEIAPWPSVIQRLGRLNRQNKQEGASARFWMPKADTKFENEKEAPNKGRIGPYEKSDVKLSHELLEVLVDELKKQNPYRSSLDNILKSEEKSKSALEILYNTVIRPQDLYDLFSTEPDLAGGFTDISRFIRDQDRNADVQIFWADFKGKHTRDLSPAKEIMCRVPFHNLRSFLETRKISGWEWDSEQREYQRIGFRDVCPGMTLLLPKNAGGYTEKMGWTGKKADRPATGFAQPIPQESLFGDNWSEGDWLTIEKHLVDAETEAKKLAGSFCLSEDYMKAIVKAARWHDVGKAHARWQASIKQYHERLIRNISSAESMCSKELTPDLCLEIKTLITKEEDKIPESLQAKFPDWNLRIRKFLKSKGKDPRVKGLYARFNPQMRHEAASTLAAWKCWMDNSDEMTALSVYLVAAHHGKVRTVLRSTQGQEDVFGIKESDALPCLPGWLEQDQTVLDLSPKYFGATGKWSDDDTFQPAMPSWVGIVAELLGKILPGDPKIIGSIPYVEPKEVGPYALAFFETLVSTADRRVSKNPLKEDSE